MPVIQPNNLSGVARIGLLDLVEAADRPVLSITDAPKVLEGAGFEVRRAFAEIDLSLADPFLLLHHMRAV